MYVRHVRSRTATCLNWDQSYDPELQLKPLKNVLALSGFSTKVFSLLNEMTFIHSLMIC
jgi:hypothetical protein